MGSARSLRIRRAVDTAVSTIRGKLKRRVAAAVPAWACEPLEQRVLFNGDYHVYDPNNVHCYLWSLNGGFDCNGDAIANSGNTSGNGTQVAQANNVNPPGGTSNAPVIYATGTPVITSNDLTSSGFGKTWGVTRSWSESIGSGPLGQGWMMEQLPTLVHVVAGGISDPLQNAMSNLGASDTIAVMVSGVNWEWFDNIGSGGAYVERKSGLDQLKSSGGSYVLYDTTGGQTQFYNFSTASHALDGMFQSYTDPYGNVTTATYDTGGSTPTYHLLNVARSNGNAIEKWVFAYNNSSYPDQITSVTLQRSFDGTTFTTAQAVAYTYYDGTTSGGAGGYLRTATITDQNGNMIDESAYRYYLSTDSYGNPGDLKMVFNPAEYTRAQAAGYDPTTATDGQVQAYASNYFKYGTANDFQQDRVVYEAAQGTGCSCTGVNGQGVFTYSYTQAPNPYNNGSTLPSYNAWAVRTTVGLPDGTQEVVYTNMYDQTMLDLTQELQPTVSISALGYSGTTATVTTTSNDGYSKGDTVVISGVVISGGGPQVFDGTFVVTSIIDVTHFTYTMSQTPTGAASGSSMAANKMTRQWGHYYQYGDVDSSDLADRVPGRLVMAADPSAVNLPLNFTAIAADGISPDEGFTDLMGFDPTTGVARFLNASSGLIEDYSWYSDVNQSSIGWQYFGGSGITDPRGGLPGHLNFGGYSRATYLVTYSEIRDQVYVCSDPWTFSMGFTSSNPGSATLSVYFDGALEGSGTSINGSVNVVSFSISPSRGWHSLTIIETASTLLSFAIINYITVGGTGNVIGDPGAPVLGPVHRVVDPGGSAPSDTVPGGVSGYLHAIFEQQGQLGVANELEAWDYLTHSTGDGQVNVVADDRVFRNADGSGAETTSYAYTWQGTDAPATVTITDPPIANSQNGQAGVTGSGTSAGTTTTIIDTSRTEANEAFVGDTISITGGPDLGQSSTVQGYDASTNTLSFWPALTTATGTTTTYSISSPVVVGGGTVSGGTSTTLTDTSLGHSDGYYNGYSLRITSGTGAGETALVTGYVASTGTLTFSPPLAVAPNSTSIYTLTWGAGATTLYYDKFRRVTQITDPDGYAQTDSYDDGTGAVTKSVVDPGTTPHLNLTTTVVPDLLGRPHEVIDPKGHVTVYTYNDPNHEVRTYSGLAAGTATASGTTTSLIDTSRSEADGTFIGYTITITGGAGTYNGSTATVTGYTASSHMLTFSSVFGASTGIGWQYVLAGITEPVQVTREYRPVGGYATATASNGTTLIDTADLSTTGSYVGLALTITGGTDNGSTATITAYNSSTHTLTFSPAFGSHTDTTTRFVLGGGTVYDETLTERPASGVSVALGSDGLPNGTEAIGTIYSLDRQILNSGDQVVEDDSYPNLTDVTYTQGTAHLGTQAFARNDLIDQGTWVGVFGGEGYNVIGNSSSYPSYATVSVTGNSTYTWSSSTSDVRALQQPGSPSNRVEAAWYSATNFTIDLNLTDGKTHQVSLYMADFDTTARSQRIDVLDATGTNVLDTASISNFNQGAWLTLSLSGHVQLKFTCTGGVNALLSGIFFDHAGNYYASSFWYDKAGNLARTQNPTDTITRTVYDALQRPISTWVGTSDITGNGTWWSPTNQGSANMVDTEDKYYDQQQAAPTGVTVSQTSHAGATQAGTYYVRVTYVTGDGESLATGETTQIVTSANLLNVTAPSITGATGYNVYVSEQLSAPSFPGSQFTNSISGTGMLTGGDTYTYVVTTLSANGETTVSSEQADSLPGTDNEIQLTWNAVPGAVGYKVYRTAANGGTGTELLLATVFGGLTTSYTDLGTITPSGSLPTSNTTGPGDEMLQNCTPVAFGGGGWTEPTTGLGFNGASFSQSAPPPIVDQVGDSNLTQVSDHPGGGAADRVTQMIYSGLDRLVAAKGGVQTSEDSTTHRPIYYYTTDNLDELTGVYQYDGDGVALSDFASGQSGLTTSDTQRLRAQTLYSYDDLGQQYRTQQYEVNQSNGSIPTSNIPILTTNTFYDHRGDVIAAAEPGGLFYKSQYDAAGRDIKDSTTDGGVISVGMANALTLANASTLTHDLVLSQTLYSYDAAGNVTLVTSRQRFDNDPVTSSGNGDLAGPSGGNLASRDYYTANWYDVSDRLTDTANLGTNDAVTYSAPALPPAMNIVSQATGAGSTTTLVDTGLSQGTDYFVGYKLTITAGPDAGGSATVTAYNSSSHTLTLSSALGSSATTSSCVYSLTPGTISGTASSGTSNTLLNSMLTQPDGTFVGWTLTITGGTDIGKSATVTGFSNSTHTLTFSPSFSPAIDNTSTFSLSLPALTSHTDYDAAGNAFRTTDPRGIATVSSFDLLGRTTQTIAAYTGNSPSNAADQTTNYTYDGSDNVLTMTAVMPSGTASQTTAYIYGVGGGNNNVFSNDLLAAVRYPTLSGSNAGNPNTAASGSESYNYNALGEQTYYTDRNGSTHNYLYDVLGRLTADIVTTVGSGVNGTVRRLGYSFDTGGRPYQQTSYSNTGGTTIINQVQDAYNGFGQLTAEYQAHTGTVSTGSTPAVRYYYTETNNGQENDSRQTGMQYPNAANTGGRVLDYAYGLQEPISQISASGTTATATYVGTSQFSSGNTIVISGAAAPQLDGTFMITGVDTTHSTFTFTFGGGYSGIDSSADINALKPSVDPLDNAISRVSGLEDHGGTSGGYSSSTPARIDEAYTYLGLDTIVQKLRGNGTMLTYLKQSGDSTPATSTAPGGDSRYTLDAFGRVTDQAWISSGGINTPQDRTQYGYDKNSNVLYKRVVDPVNTNGPGFSELYHANGSSNGYDNLNRLKEFTRGTLNSTNDSVTGTAARDQTWTLDAQGNWTTLQTTVNGGTPSSQGENFNSQNQITSISGLTTPTYDNNGNTTKDQAGATYTYDAWNRMVASGTTEVFSYDANGRRPALTYSSGTITDSYYSSDWQTLEEDSRPSSGSPVVQSQYVWSLSYLDDMVLRDDNSTSGSLGKGSSGLGRRIYAEQDANHNVTSLTDSSGNVLERFVYDPYGNFSVLSPTWATSSDSKNWVYYFQGGRYDSNTGLYNFRMRDYNPTLGRWMEQDPLGYPDGPNRYEMEGGDPVGSSDPLGLTWKDGWGEALKALVGRAEPSVQSAFDQSAWDRSHGTADAIAKRASLGFQNSVGGHTFDARDRANAESAAGNILDTEAVLLGAAACPGGALARGLSLYNAAVNAVGAGRNLASAYKKWPCDKWGAAQDALMGLWQAYGAYGAAKGAMGNNSCFVAGTMILVVSAAHADIASEGVASWSDWRYWAGGVVIVAGPVGYLILARKERKRRTGRVSADLTDDGHETSEPAWVPLVPRDWLLRQFTREALVRRFVSPLLRPHFALERLDRRW